MKSYLLVATALMSLGACSDSEKENDIIPKHVTASFNQDFSLNYRQQATLPSAGQAELTVEVSDLYYKLCPKTARCFTADFVNPTLNVTDAQGQTQEVKLSMHKMTSNYPNWLDTTSVRANRVRYVVYYKIYDVKAECERPEKKDITVVLRVTKPVANSQ